MNIIDLLVTKQIFPTRGEAKHIVVAGGIKVNGVLVIDINADIDLTGETVIMKGKKFEIKIQPEQTKEP